MKSRYNTLQDFWVHILTYSTSAKVKQAEQEDPQWSRENLKKTHRHKYKHLYKICTVYTKCIAI